MKLKDIENPKLMNLKELSNLFKNWFLDGITKEEGWVLYSIFSDNNRWLYLPTNQIIETGTIRFFSSFLSEMCYEKTNYGNFYMSSNHIDDMDLDVIKKVHRIVNPEIELIEDYWDKETYEIRKSLYDTLQK